MTIRERVKRQGEKDASAGKSVEAFYDMKIPRHSESLRALYEIAWRDIAERLRKKEPPVPALGWPCHSFIREPIYRKISLSKEIRLTDKGITLRQRTIREGLYRVTELSWEQLFRKRGKRK